MRNKGNTYRKLTDPDRIDNLQTAIVCFNQALDVFTKNNYPVDWVKTISEKARAYRDIAELKDPACLEEAVKSYELAWAEIQRNWFDYDPAMRERIDHALLELTKK